MSSATVGKGNSTVYHDVISIINHLPKSELKKLKPEKIKEIISSCGNALPHLTKEDYSDFALRFQNIPTESSVCLYRWFIDQVQSEEVVATVLNSFKPKTLTKLIKADARSQCKMLKEKVVLDYLKFLDQIFTESVSQELHLPYENPAKFAAMIEKIQAKYDADDLSTLCDFIETRAAQLARLAFNTILFNRAAREMELVVGFLDLLNKAGDSEKISKSLQAIDNQIVAIRDDEWTYLSTPGHVDYHSCFTESVADKIRALMLDTRLTPLEKKQFVQKYLTEIKSDLEKVLSKASSKIELLKNSKHKKDLDASTLQFQQCINEVEDPFHDEGEALLRECSSLQTSLGTRDSFLAKLDSIGDNLTELQNLEAELTTILERVVNLKKRSLIRSEMISNDEDVQYWWQFLTKHRFESQLTLRSTSLIDHYSDSRYQGKLSTRCLKELNVKHRLELSTLYYNSLSYQISENYKQVISGVSDKAPGEMSEQEWGLHQKAVWQLKTVRERIQSQFPMMSVAGSSTDAPPSRFNAEPSRTLEDEQVDIVTKISELGITPSDLEQAPFFIPKPLFYDESQRTLPVDWRVYADIFMEKGIKYSDIEKIESFEEFQNWYGSNYTV